MRNRRRHILEQAIVAVSAALAATMAPVAGAGDRPSAEPARLATLWRQGDIESFVATAISREAIVLDEPTSAAWRVEALLATGANAEAERASLDTLRALSTELTSVGSTVPRSAAPSATDRDQRQRFAKLWLAGRLRQSRCLDDVLVDELLGSAGMKESFSTLLFWRRELGGLAPYRPSGSAGRASLPLETVEPNLLGSASSNIERSSTSLAAEEIRDAREGRGAGLQDERLPAFRLELNGAPLHGFVDTGGQHTIVSRAAAAAAGLEQGEEPRSMVGFAEFSARPAIVRRMRIGEVSLSDVPVFVADSPPLLASGGQVSLGIDLMSVLDFTLDYPRARMTVVDRRVAGSSVESPAPADGGKVWEIPVWTFSFAALAQGRLPDGEFARTLIDTGNCSGTFVSSDWSRHLRSSGHVAALARRLGFTRPAIGQWRLGDRELERWPVRGTLPPGLDRLGVLDVLVGHDLLADYRVEVDLANRRMRLARAAADARAPSGRESDAAPRPASVGSVSR